MNDMNLQEILKSDTVYLWIEEQINGWCVALSNIIWYDAEDYITSGFFEEPNDATTSLESIKSIMTALGKKVITEEETLCY